MKVSPTARHKLGNQELRATLPMMIAGQLLGVPIGILLLTTIRSPSRPSSRHLRRPARPAPPWPTCTSAVKTGIVGAELTACRR